MLFAPSTLTAAKYAGVCKKTGRAFEPGRPIVKGIHGWEIAPAVFQTEDGPMINSYQTVNYEAVK